VPATSITGRRSRFVAQTSSSIRELLNTENGPEGRSARRSSAPPRGPGRSNLFCAGRLCASTSRSITRKSLTQRRRLWRTFTSLVTRGSCIGSSLCMMRHEAVFDVSCWMVIAVQQVLRAVLGTTQVQQMQRGKPCCQPWRHAVDLRPASAHSGYTQLYTTEYRPPVMDQGSL